MRVVFVHGACVRDGSWWWHRTAELLQERGVPSVAPALPSCGEAGLPGGVGGRGCPRMLPRCGRCCRPATSRPSWSPTATAASSPRRPPRESGRCVTCCWSPATCPRSGRACRSSGTARTRPVPRRRPRRRHVRGPARAARGHVPAGLRLRGTGAGGGPPRPAEPAGNRAAGRGGRMAAGALDVPRLRSGPGHSGRACSASSPAGPAASSSSTPATTRSCPGLQQSGTCY